jgi:hypothetical protein
MVASSKPDIIQTWMYHADSLWLDAETFPSNMCANDPYNLHPGFQAAFREYDFNSP